MVKFHAQISEDDEFIFCGTTSGDILKIYLETMNLKHCGPVGPLKKKLSGVSLQLESFYS